MNQRLKELLRFQNLRSWEPVQQERTEWVLSLEGRSKKWNFEVKMRQILRIGGSLCLESLRWVRDTCIRLLFQNQKLLRRIGVHLSFQDQLLEEDYQSRQKICTNDFRSMLKIHQNQNLKENNHQGRNESRSKLIWVMLHKKLRTRLNEWNKNYSILMKVQKQSITQVLLLKQNQYHSKTMESAISKISYLTQLSI